MLRLKVLALASVASAALMSGAKADAIYNISNDPNQPFNTTTFATIDVSLTGPDVANIRITTTPGYDLYSFGLDFNAQQTDIDRPNIVFTSCCAHPGTISYDVFTNGAFLFIPFNVFNSNFINNDNHNSIDNPFNGVTSIDFTAINVLGFWNVATNVLTPNGNGFVGAFEMRGPGLPFPTTVSDSGLSPSCPPGTNGCPPSPPTGVPEPASAILLVTGLLGLHWARTRYFR